VVLLAVLLFSAAATMNADVMVFDRGLPTSGINAPVSAARSNVAWADYTPYDGSNWAIGDDFILGGAGTYDITDLRVWIVGTDSQQPSYMWSDLTLFGGGTAPGSVNVLSPSSIVVNQVTSPTYTGSSGSTIEIWQVDFLLNWTVTGGVTNTFFVGGTPTAANIALYGTGVSPFLHASNAALSGSTQDGADNLYREISYSGLTVSSMDMANSNGNGWDKSSDINVQVFAATPEPSAWVLMGTLLLSLGFLVRRRYQ